MSIFRVHCVTRIRANATREERMGAVSQYFFTYLEKLFKEVCRYQESAYDDASAYWWTDRPVHHAPHEPILWILRGRADSMIKRVYNVNIPAGIAGANLWGPQGNISEIYLEHDANSNSTAQAKMAFHELMHNKLRMGNEMHSKTFGLGRQMLDLSSAISARLTSDDAKMMAPALETPRMQYVTPFSDNT